MNKLFVLIELIDEFSFRLSINKLLMRKESDQNDEEKNFEGRKTQLDVQVRASDLSFLNENEANNFLLFRKQVYFC